MRWIMALGIALIVSATEAQAAGRWIQCQSFADAQRLLKLSYKLALHITNIGDRQCGKVANIIKGWKEFSCEVMAENPGNLGQIVSSNSLVAAQIVKDDPRDDRFPKRPLATSGCLKTSRTSWRPSNTPSASMTRQIFSIHASTATV